MILSAGRISDKAYCLLHYFSEKYEFLCKNPNMVLQWHHAIRDLLGHQHHHGNLVEVYNEESLSEFVLVSIVQIYLWKAI